MCDCGTRKGFTEKDDCLISDALSSPKAVSDEGSARMRDRSTIRNDTSVANHVIF